MVTDEELLAWLRERGPRMIKVDAEMVALTADRIEALVKERDVAIKVARNEIGWRNQVEAERDAAVEAKLDAISTLDAWFDRRKLGHDAVDQAVVDAASGYLRTSRVGGMPQDESNLILGVIQDMARLGLFADLFARAHLGAKP